MKEGPAAKKVSFVDPTASDGTQVSLAAAVASALSECLCVCKFCTLLLYVEFVGL